jgi:hypothetical protein
VLVLVDWDAPHLLAGRKSLQLLMSLYPAGPRLARPQTALIQFGGVDAKQPEGHVSDLQGIAVAYSCQAIDRRGGT